MTAKSFIEVEGEWKEFTEVIILFLFKKYVLGD